jgi:DNA-binding MarR family transcriptional regulator
MLVRTMRRPRVRKALGAGAATGLDRSAHMVLATLEVAGPSRLSAIAEALTVDASTLSRQVTQLEADGLVERSRDASDGRAVLLSLSTRGSARLQRAREVRLAGLAEALRDWSDADLHRFAGFLDRCTRDLLEHSESAAASMRDGGAGEAHHPRHAQPLD